MQYRVRLSQDGRSLAGDVDTLATALEGSTEAVALTGAGISVESGIPDFRSPGGLWSVFDPMKYGTLSCFLQHPAKAWELYRALGSELSDKKPNPAHHAMARLQRRGLLAEIITQNVDGLHQAAGSRRVIEIHGEHGNLHCIGCGHLEPFLRTHLEPGPVPRCPECTHPLKPNVVLFEEPPRKMSQIGAALQGCRRMLVIGTSAQVVPASLFPGEVLGRGGSLLEFNIEETTLTGTGLGPAGVFVQGPVGITMPLAAELLIAQSEGGGAK